MAKITAQELADSITYAVSERIKLDEPASFTLRGGFENSTVRGEFELEIGVAALNEMRKA